MKVTKKFYWIHFRFLVALTFLSAIVCGWGWYLSNPVDGMPFARSGSVATMILIAFLVSNYTEKLEQVEVDIRVAIEKSGNWTPVSKTSRNQLTVDVKELTKRIKTIIRWWYAALMLLATFIWGLGDCFYSLVSREPSLTIFEIFYKLLHFTS